MTYDSAMQILKSIVQAGETFSGFNKPKRTPNHPRMVIYQVCKY